MSYVIVFLTAAALDVAYCHWMLHVRDNEPLRAALYSMGIGACGLLGITGVVADHWLAVPYLLGLGYGTFIGTYKPKAVWSAVKQVDHPVFGQIIYYTGSELPTP